MALLSSEDAEAVEPEMEDLICRGKHEDLGHEGAVCACNREDESA